jgi:hypothetical protein
MNDDWSCLLTFGDLERSPVEFASEVLTGFELEEEPDLVLVCDEPDFGLVGLFKDELWLLDFDCGT